MHQIKSVTATFVPTSPDFLRPEDLHDVAAIDFFACTTKNNGWPEVIIGYSGAYLAGPQKTNLLLQLHRWFWRIDVLKVKYLNKIIG